VRPAAHIDTSRTAVALLAILAASATWAGGPLLIDHPVNQDESGIWNPNVERALLRGLTVGQLGLALWEGGESRLGDTAWRGIDSEIIGAVSTEAVKHTFTRVAQRGRAIPTISSRAGPMPASQAVRRPKRPPSSRPTCSSTEKTIPRSMR
jgi:hypothetical protein